jgi:hypothetical protein
MEPVSLILAALLAGATKGVGETAGSAVRDAYTGLRELLRRKLAGKPAADSAIEEYTTDPESWRPALEAYLRQVGADSDGEIITAAEAVMEEADPDGARAGKYTVDLRGAQGVQIGDGNFQRNDFGYRPN